MSARKSPRSRFRELYKNWAVPVGCGLFFLCLLKIVFFVGVVPTGSMEPAIREGSFIVGLRLFNEPERGDIMVFTRNNRTLVKRISGVPGDTVYIDCEALTVPDGCYFMLGDNAKESIDSRYWDEPFIKREHMRAKVFNKTVYAKII